MIGGIGFAPITARLTRGRFADALCRIRCAAAKPDARRRNAASR